MLAIIFFAVIGFSLSRSHGNYREEWVLLFTAAWLVYLIQQLRGRLERKPAPDILLYAVLLIFTGRLLHHPGLMYAEPGAGLTLIPILLWLALAGALAFVAGGLKEKKRLWQTGFWLAAIALLGARIAVIFASPHPAIDVFIKNQMAVDHLLHGRNPYTQTFPLMYGGMYGQYFGYPYLPGLLYWLAPFQWLFGDHRVAYIAADLGAAWVIYRLARKKGLLDKTAKLLSLLWLSFPVCLFILEQAWIDTLLLFVAALVFLHFQARRWWIAGFFCGFLLLVKQYAIFIPFALFAGEALGRKNGKGALALLGGGVSAFLVLLSPFLIASSRAFYFNTIAAYSALALRPDSFSLLAWLYHRFGVTVSPNLSVVLDGVGFLLLILSVIKRPRLSYWISGVAAYYGLVFLFGKQAFCNYYQFLAYLVLLAVVTKGSEAVIPLVPTSKSS